MGNPAPQPANAAASDGPVLSVVLPTFKERDNVAELVRRLDSALAGIRWESIFVDDNSPDGTADAVKALAAKDARVRCLRRVGRRGLAGACIEGMLSSSAPYVAVMDADLQHDETVLPKMLGKLIAGEADLVAATRYVEGGSAESFGQARGTISRVATKITHSVLGIALSDPMSGFFMMRRDKFDEIVPRLSPAGFKILLDIVTAGDHLRVAEQPFVFGTRHAGESKFNIQVGLEFLGLLLAKLSGGFAVLTVALWSASFPVAQSIATFAAMTSNFFLNNELTYRDRRLKGWSMARGFLGFCIFCSAGALTNVGLASWLYTEREVWWVAGIAGAVMGAFWNYAMSSLFIWRTR
jgi:dolichol-phosphate mannosyltransferase